ncbi:HEAT repeat domain-containing protein [Cellvibrio fontiphilus]|uniref:HEAT repeat domain-containing protein n=1 Tax=Cellvibrio fontiphilus TaxID=1815559 RepID=A0ABV7FHD6_9GAMM
MKTAALFSIPTLFAALAGAFITYTTLQVTSDSQTHKQTIRDLENKIVHLEFLLAQHKQPRSAAADFAFAQNRENTGNMQQQKSPELMAGAKSELTTTATDNTSSDNQINSDQLIKDLSTVSERDPRPFSSKVRDLLQTNNSVETVALVSQSLAYLAGNTELLPDHELDTLYQQQQSDELKRVAAQIMSARGDNRLLEQHITSLQPKLNSESAQTRQQALVELAKTGYANAANAIAPLLDDEDSGVKLDALLALRATGNQSHIYLVEKLRNHSDPSVSWLAEDVINQLQNLSSIARTKVSSNDITANLRPVAAIN